jgi:hypothetical protein
MSNNNQSNHPVSLSEPQGHKRAEEKEVFNFIAMYSQLTQQQKKNSPLIRKLKKGILDKLTALHMQYGVPGAFDRYEMSRKLAHKMSCERNRDAILQKRRTRRNGNAACEVGSMALDSNIDQSVPLNLVEVASTGTLSSVIDSEYKHDSTSNQSGESTCAMEDADVVQPERDSLTVTGNHYIVATERTEDPKHIQCHTSNKEDSVTVCK